MKFLSLLLALALIGSTSAVFAAPKPTAKPKAKPAAKPAIPAIFYDAEWSYQTITYYDYDKKPTDSFTTGSSGTAKFERNGKFRQDYYIGSIGNFFKGTYKIKGDTLTTFDEKGKKIFDFKFTVGTSTKPPVLVLTLLDEKGRKSVIYGLKPIEKKKQ